jgi:hypothetical protein
MQFRSMHWSGTEEHVRPDTRLLRVAYYLRVSGAHSVSVFGSILTVHGAGIGGYDVKVLRRSNQYELVLDGIQEAFPNEHQLVSVLKKAVSEQCRLRTTFAGGRPVRWELESRTECGLWLTLLSSGYCVWFAPLLSRRVEYRSNFQGADGEFLGLHRQGTVAAV